MSTSLTVGKARLSTVSVITGGLPDSTSPLTTGTGNASTLRVRVNPSNPREVGVLALAQSAGVNASVTVNGQTATELFVVSAAPPPADGPTFGAWGPEIDPPSWLASV
jgi:hypothetical protein